jgi:hypothetical protein
MSAEHDVRVSVISAEAAADYALAEFSAGGHVIGYTRLVDGEVVLTLEPRDTPLVVNARSLHEALLRAKELLSSY